MARSAVFSFIVAVFYLCMLTVVKADENRSSSLEKDFRLFLETYRDKVQMRDAQYLKVVHPDLPSEMYSFFFDITLEMMSFAQQEGIEPTIECKEFNVCKVTWPQAGDSWAAQRFILHQNEWRWLE